MVVHKLTRMQETESWWGARGNGNVFSNIFASRVASVVGRVDAKSIYNAYSSSIHVFPFLVYTDMPYYRRTSSLPSRSNLYVFPSGQLRVIILIPMIAPIQLNSLPEPLRFLSLFVWRTRCILAWVGLSVLEVFDESKVSRRDQGS